MQPLETVRIKTAKPWKGDSEGNSCHRLSPFGYPLSPFQGEDTASTTKNTKTTKVQICTGFAIVFMNFVPFVVQLRTS